MRRGNDDFFHPTFSENGDIAFGQVLKQAIVSCLSNTLTTTAFLRAQNAEVRSSFLQYAGGSPSHTSNTRVVSGSTTGEIQQLGVLGEGLDVEAIGPVCTLLPCFAPRITDAAEVRHHIPKASRHHLSLHHDAAYRLHDVYYFNAAGTALNTSSTSSA